MVGERFLSQHEGDGGDQSRSNIPGVTSDPGRELSESSSELRGFIHVWPFFFQAHEADAVMVDGGLVYEAGLKPYNLKPVVAEFYGSKDGASLMETQVSVLTQLLWGEARTLSVLHLQGTSCWGSLYCERLSPALTCGGWKLGSFWETVDFKPPDGNAAGCC